MKVVKTGPGGLDLSGTNTFTGGLVINAGLVFSAGDSSLGASSGGITFAGNATLVVTNGVGSGRTITVNDGVAATFYSTAVREVAGALTGPGGVTSNFSTNNNTLIFSSPSNTFTGPVNIASGRLTFASLADTAGGR